MFIHQTTSTFRILSQITQKPCIKLSSTKHAVLHIDTVSKKHTPGRKEKGMDEPTFTENCLTPNVSFLVFFIFFFFVNCLLRYVKDMI